MNLGNLTTEQNSKYNNLEKMSVDTLIRNINKEDQSVPFAILKARKQISALVQQAIRTIDRGGRIFYIGAGTSGRLGIVDASECPPTFGVKHNKVIGIIAGGDKAIRKAVEGAEDSKTQAIRDLGKHKISRKDFVIGIAASGRTPYVVSGLSRCKVRKIPTGCIVCNKKSSVAKYSQFPIEVIVGPEFLTGSSRMKAGTAQKLILNIITTITFIKTGKKMVSMKMSNDKLIERGVLMVMESRNTTRAKAIKLLKNNKLKDLVK